MKDPRVQTVKAGLLKPTHFRVLTTRDQVQLVMGKRVLPMTYFQAAELAAKLRVTGRRCAIRGELVTLTLANETVQMEADVALWAAPKLRDASQLVKRQLGIQGAQILAVGELTDAEKDYKYGYDKPLPEELKNAH